MNPPVLLYEHAGSANHGCEAIANTLIKLFSPAAFNGAPVLLSSRSAEDRLYSIGRAEKEGRVKLLSERHLQDSFVSHVWHYARYKITGNRGGYSEYRLKEGIEETERQADRSGERPVAVAIGGDNYCYPELLEDLIGGHERVLERGWRSVLYGCSVEDPDTLLLTREQKLRLTQDLLKYDLIVAREPLTYGNLTAMGIPEEKLGMMPDPAFSLERDEDAPLPEGFLAGETVGLNLSPMAEALEGGKGASAEAFRSLIKHILDAGKESVALIPHVVKSGGDDRTVLDGLYREYADDPRVIMVHDADCTVLKKIISSCSAFVGARTHATIAAYSSCVPTLVIGYSIKSKGIAKDIFGEGETYVRPVQEITDAVSLIEDYEKLRADEGRIRSRLKEIMPGYIKKSACNQARDMVFYSP